MDWIGISLYAQKYFLGDPNQKEENEIVFKSGINSNPVIAVKEICEKAGENSSTFCIFISVFRILKRK